MTRYLVTSALPYANGPIHFGHVIGAYLPADCYVRTLRMQGEDVRFICGADEHGVAITIGADQEGVPYAEYVARWRDEIKSTFDRLDICFDVWSGTSISPEHAQLSQKIFSGLSAGEYLKERTTEQFYCTSEGRFLADRYVLGTCYLCGREDARGDECPGCGAWLEPLKLQNPRCGVCGAEPETRSTTHWYLDLPRLRDEFIGKWFKDGTWKPNVEHFVEAMLEDVQPRPITRDMDWGVPVPAPMAGSREGKVLYVWFDAPIGYISFTQEWAKASGDPDAWKRYWCDGDTRLVHFIGKDNIPFHCLVFPSMLHGSGQGYILPWRVPANEFYNLQGRKFSTSENWTIPLTPFFEKYDRDVTRFYLLSSTPETADSEWRWEGFQTCVNSSLADTIGNLVTRVLRFCAKYHDGHIPPMPEGYAAAADTLILGECGEIADPAESIRGFRFRRACEQLVANAAIGNVYIDRTAPWALRKTDPEAGAAALNTACEWISLIARWMAPFMPSKAQEIWRMLGREGDVCQQAWPAIPIAGGGWRTCQAGALLGEIGTPFTKLEDAAIEEEIRSLEERSRTPEA